MQVTRLQSIAKTAVPGALALAAAFAAPVPGTAQQYSVRGVVQDSAGVSLSGVMAVALAKPDSVLTQFATAGPGGQFSIGRLGPGEYILQLTLIGYATIRQDFAITDSDVEVGIVKMSTRAVELDPLVVSIDHVPFLITSDTLAYNAAAFEVRPNATVEELLERLPGIEVDEDGTITAQGEEVENVLVEGREFFGDDPTIATRNLRADAVETVEVYDRLSDMAEFTGIPDGQEELTINLDLREEAKAGYFGMIEGGLGADLVEYPDVPLGSSPVAGRDMLPYNGGLSLFRFDMRTQLAVLGGANNVNSGGFGGVSFRGGGGEIGGGNGFSESMNGGVNFSSRFGENSSVETSYFLGMRDNRSDSQIKQQLLLGSDVTSHMDRKASDLSETDNHNLSLNARWGIADGHDIRLRGRMGISAALTTSNSQQETRAVAGDVLNSALTDRVSERGSTNGNAVLTWRKRLADNGRSLFAELRGNLSDSEVETDLESDIKGEGIGREGQQDILQEQTSVGQTFTQGLRLSMTEPLSAMSQLELFAETRSLMEDEDQSVWDLGSGSPVLNDEQSSAFERTYSYLQGGFRLNASTSDTRLTLGLRVQGSNLDGHIIDRDEEITNGYTHWLPTADYRIQVSRQRQINIRYTTSTQEPSLTQLQTFTDNSNPLNIYTGNPNLTPEYRHSIRAEYRSFDMFSFRNLFVYVRANYLTNNITQSRTVTEAGIQSRMPVNLGDSWNIGGWASFGTPLRFMGADVDLDYGLNFNNSQEYVNGDQNDTHRLVNTIGVELENRVKRTVDVSVGVTFDMNDVQYSLSEELNQNYVNTRLNTRAAVYAGAWYLSSQFSYRVFDQDVYSDGQDVAYWQASISRRLLGDKAEVKLAAFDLLRQNQGVNFTNTASYIQEERVQVPGQYAMLTFSWNLGFGMMSGAGGGIVSTRGRG